MREEPSSVLVFPLVIGGVERSAITPEVDNATLARLLGFRKISSQARVWRDQQMFKTAPLKGEAINELKEIYPLRWVDSQFAEYDLAPIPTPALERYAKVYDSGAFEHFEIWASNEKATQVLIGVRDNGEHYPIVMWGDDRFADTAIALLRSHGLKPTPVTVH